MAEPPYLTATLGDLQPRVASRLDRLRHDEVVARIWDRDPSVWGGTNQTPELANRLGWLESVPGCRAALVEAGDFVVEARRRYSRIVLCGMGGSSLAPEVIVRTCRRPDGSPRFHMLDSTAPEALAAAGADTADTLFVVSSKSGSTIETLSFQEYFWAETGGRGSQFVAITDPGSGLDRTAREHGFAWVFSGDPEIGGRYSALSPFGLGPAVLAGIDGTPLLDAGEAAGVVARNPAGPENPAALLGCILGEAAVTGRDKLVLALSPGVRTFGLWVEQLIAESTGKGGLGILPVSGLRSDRSLGADRILVTLALAADDWPGDHRRRVAAAREAGVPVVELRLAGPGELGGEFFRWEFATAVAGAVLGVNPFDQPNVSESKSNTGAVLAGEMDAAAPPDPDAARAVLRGVRSGDYVAILAYLPPSAEHDRELDAAAATLEETTGVAVTWGYGPRYLHSTGQLHKGGPARGTFIQILPDGGADVPVPGRPYSFGTLFRAQADGDFAALRNRGRPVARIRSLNDVLGG